MKIATGRPYPPTGLDSTRWQEIEPRWVSLSSLVSTQDGVLLEPLLRPSTPVSGDPYPHVVSWRGALYLEDGHTRVARWVLSRRASMLARVFDAEESA